MTGSHVPPGAGTHYPMIDGDHVAKAAIQDTHGEFEVFEVQTYPGPGAPPHASPWTAVLYVLDGRVTVQVDGVTHVVEPGGLVTMPAGIPCTFEVAGDVARFLAITSGGGASRFFADSPIRSRTTDPSKSRWPPSCPSRNGTVSRSASSTHGDDACSDAVLRTKNSHSH